MFHFLSDASVPAAARPRQTAVWDGRGAGHGADPAAGGPRSAGSPQTGGIHHQHHGVLMCTCPGPRGGSTEKPEGACGAAEVRGRLTLGTAWLMITLVQVCNSERQQFLCICLIMFSLSFNSKSALDYRHVLQQIKYIFVSGLLHRRPRFWNFKI